MNRNNVIKPIKADVTNTSKKKNSSVLGTYTGKCCDSNVFNNNDMHLSREVFETLMASDEYKRAMQNHHYIGFLGHPDNSDCQDFEHACLVMKDMRLADDGEIEGDFDLVNTPVGRIVKAFIDVGVNFGISIRGLGDVDANGEVDPDQFIFRGFDLVTFPAYDDCIPEFKEVAASTDIKKKANYKKVCAAIDANLQAIKSSEALTLIKEQLPDDSEEYIKVDNRLKELNEEVAETVSEVDNDEAIAIAVTEQKLEAMTDLYLEAKAEVRELEQKITDLSSSNQDLTVQCSTMKQKQARFKRIVANQLEDADSTIEDAEHQIQAAENKASKYEAAFRRMQASLKSAQHELRNANQVLASTEAKLDEKNQKIADLNKECRGQVMANNRLKQRLNNINAAREAQKDDIKASKDLNLKYQQKIEANSEAISQKDSQIEDLKSKLRETVTASQKLESKASNLDEKNRELLSRVEAAEEMVLSYQQAYADIYANALGVCLRGLPITASTSVEELKQMIKSGTSTASIPAASAYSEVVEGDYIEGDETVLDDEDGDIDNNGNYFANMVTL